jgi:hypothetical protein
MIGADDVEENDAMIGGADNDVDTTRSPQDVVRQFLCALRRRWPCLCVDLTDNDTSEYWVVLATEIDRLTLPVHGVMHIVRDSEMQAHLDETGGTPMKDGEGPLSLWFRPLDSSGCYRFDLVTPEVTELNEFSRWAVEQLKEAADRDPPCDGR